MIDVRVGLDGQTLRPVLPELAHSDRQSPTLVTDGGPTRGSLAGFLSVDFVLLLIHLKESGRRFGGTLQQGTMLARPFRASEHEIERFDFRHQLSLVVVDKGVVQTNERLTAIGVQSNHVTEHLSGSVRVVPLNANAGPQGTRLLDSHCASAQVGSKHLPVGCREFDADSLRSCDAFVIGELTIAVAIEPDSIQ